MDNALRLRLAPAADRRVPVSTLQAVLGVPGAGAAEYVRLVGATGRLSFAQFVTVICLSGPHARPDAAVWKASAGAIEGFLAPLGDASAPAHPPAGDQDPVLVAGTVGAVVMSRAESLDYPEDDGGVERYRLGALTCVTDLLPALRAMLDELDRHQLG